MNTGCVPSLLDPGNAHMVRMGNGKTLELFRRALGNSGVPYIELPVDHCQMALVRWVLRGNRAGVAEEPRSEECPKP